MAMTSHDGAWEVLPDEIILGLSVRGSDGLEGAVREAVSRCREVHAAQVSDLKSAFVVPGADDEGVSMMERHDEAWVALPDQILDTIGLRFDYIEETISDVVYDAVSRCFDLHVAEVARLFSGASS